MTTVTLIPGDGIGPEVSEATRRVVDALGVGHRLGGPRGRGAGDRDARDAPARPRSRVDPTQPGRAQRAR